MPLYPEFERVYLSGSETVSLLPSDVPVRWVLLRGREILVENGESEGLRLPDVQSSDLPGLVPRLLGRYGGITYLTGVLEEGYALPDGWSGRELRALYGQVSEVEWQIAGYASQVWHWERTSGFCPVCGHAMEPVAKEWMRRCPQCGHMRYPQVSPAVLALVHDGADRVLLAHKPGWGDRYSILAGFVLPGESLEECVAREVEEEVGVQVTDLVYEGSQPWPFPHQLMIGFTARYVRGEIRLDEEELDRAAWFPANALPSLPPPLSLSRQIIDRWRQSVLEKG